MAKKQGQEISKPGRQDKELLASLGRTKIHGAAEEVAEEAPADAREVTTVQ